MLVVLHHNDTHSRIEPLGNDSRYAGSGGVVRQAAYVAEVRSRNPQVLLFHCGDFVQGTPYFNLFRGQAEIECMNLLRYDAVCLGNHEFDNGLENLREMIVAANFPVVATNLDFTGTPLEGLTHPYLIIQRGPLLIGVLGLTVSPDGLVARANYEGVQYLDPIRTANETAARLKHQAGCDLIICLSHLGYNADGQGMGDVTLARSCENIDMILGGHSHTLLPQPDRQINPAGQVVVINQVGDRGVFMGRLDVALTKN
jgi:5'-nucleotidase